MYRHLAANAVLLFVGLIMLVPGIGLRNLDAQTLSASVDRNTLAAGERLSVTFEIKGGSGRKFKAPPFEGFNLLSGPNQSSNVTMINGQVSQTISYSYVLQATQQGKYTIKPASVEINGKTFRSKAISVTVKKASAKSSQGQNAQQSMDLSEHIFLRVRADKRKVYQGEQIVVSYKLYTRFEQFADYDIKQPDLSGFWVQEIDKDDNKAQIEVLNGVRYLVHTLKHAVLFPQRSGELQLDPLEFECVVRVRAQQKRRRRRSLFDDFFGESYQNVKHTARSKAVKITVLPLPAAGKPADFSGAVGKFTLASSISSQETAVNEAVTFKMTIAGDGNIKLLNRPAPFFPSAFEGYDPKTSENIKVSAKGVSGRRSFEYLLIPRTPGEYKIAPVSFSYFDPKSESYISLQTDEYLIQVAKGTGAGGAAVATGISREDVEILSRDISFIKTTLPAFRRREESFYQSPLTYSLLAAPLFLFIGFVFYLRRSNELRGNELLSRNRKATKLARGRLAQAKKAMSDGRHEVFYDEVSKALWGYLSDKLSIPLAELNKDNVTAVLQSRAAHEETIERYLSTLDHCEFARFAPGSQADQDMQRVYQYAVELLTQMEEALK